MTRDPNGRPSEPGQDTLSRAGVSVDGEPGDAAVIWGAADDGSTKTLKVGDVVEVRLRGNPTTGYTWEAKTDPAVLKSLESDGYKQESAPAGSPPVVGRGGIFRFRYRAAAAGRTALAFAYRRPWEQQPPARKVIIHVRVKPPHSREAEAT